MRRSLLGSQPWRLALFCLPALFLAVFFFYPLAAILAHALNLSGMREAPNVRYLLHLAWFTTWQAVVSTALTLAVGLPGAHVFARYRFPGKSLLQTLTTIPFVLPTLIVASAFLSLIGPNGILNLALVRLFQLADPPLKLQHTIWIILLAHVFYNYSIVIRVVGGQWSHLNPTLEESARVLGASRWRAWREVVLPQLMPAVASAGLLTFLFCFTSFGVVMVLGGPRFATIEVEIYRQTAHWLNLPVAALLAVVQLVLTFVLAGAYTALQRRSVRPLDYRSRRATQRAAESRRSRSWIGANLLFMFGLLLAPLAALAWRSFTLGGGFGFRYYQALAADPGRSVFFTPPLNAIRNSLAFSLATVVLSLLLGTLGAYLLASRHPSLQRITGWLDPLLILPLGTSAVTLGFGYLIVFGRPPLNWVTSPALVPVVHSLIAFPFVVRSVLPALRGIRASLREAAAVLGSTPLRAWQAVDLPLITRALGSAAAYAFTISIGEFGATLLIARTEYATMPVVIYRYLSQPGLTHVGQALAMSTLLMVACALGFVAIERLEIGQTGAF